VLTAERNVKFHSSQTVPGQYTAESATPNEDHHADIKRVSLQLNFVPNILFHFVCFQFSAVIFVLRSFAKTSLEGDAGFA
jgi:hypothetical protein